MNDIANRNDIKLFVDSFYGKVRNDVLLSPIFSQNIPEETWPLHLEKIYNFWSAILFAEKGFEGNPMEKHMGLPINEKHFNQWLFLFNQTINEHFAGPKADEAKKRAHSIAQIMLFKIAASRS
jgi:hemoglobin